MHVYKSKNPYRRINFHKIEWDHFRHSIVAKVSIEGRVVSLTHMNKDFTNRLEFYSLHKDRIPLLLKAAASYKNMATGSILLNHRITPKNAKTEFFKVMQKGEILVDWYNGFVYYKKGPSSVQTEHISEWFLIDRQKLADWRFEKEVNERLKREDEENEDRDTDQED